MAGLSDASDELLAAETKLAEASREIGDKTVIAQGFFTVLIICGIS